MPQVELIGIKVVNAVWCRALYTMASCFVVLSFVFSPLLPTATAETISAETGIVYKHGYAFLSEPKYGPEATHFDYINPQAPKGGSFRFREMGNWDSFNPVPLRGRLVVGTYYWVKEWRYLWDSLLRDALDEPSSYYGLIAEGIAVDPEGKWIAFKLRQEARWHDGQPLTVNDVVYSFEVATTIAKPEVTQPMKPFERIEVIGEREVKFHIRKADWGNPMLPIRVGNMPIFPKHYWQNHDITKTTIVPPLGSGPYRIGKFSVGRWVEWERVKDYWAKDLPVNKGHWNFDTVRWEYFRDDTVQTEAVKAHVLDAHQENIARNWHAAYDVPAYHAGLLKKERYKLSKPAGLWWPMFFNLDQPRFLDIRVREALWLMQDPVWSAQRNYGFYGVATSFFQGSELASRGLPSELELKLLEPLRDMIPERVFTQAFTIQPNSGAGFNRDNILRATALLKEAGWEIRDQVLVNTTTNEQFELRFLAVSAALGRSFVSYTKRLERLGIKSSIQAPENSNWLYRIRSGDFDVGSIWFLPDIPPTQLLSNQFLSVGADQDYSYNWANIRDPAIDRLIQAVNEAPTWEEFIAACRAIDRVLLWNFYFIAASSRTDVSLVYWDKFGRPDHNLRVSRSDQIMTWWWDEEKARKVTTFTGEP